MYPEKIGETGSSNYVPTDVANYLKKMPNNVQIRIVNAFWAEKKLKEIEQREEIRHLCGKIIRLAGSIKFQDFEKLFKESLNNNCLNDNWGRIIETERINRWGEESLIIRFSLLGEDLGFEVKKGNGEYSRLDFCFPKNMSLETQKKLSNRLITILESA